MFAGALVVLPIITVGEARATVGALVATVVDAVEDLELVVVLEVVLKVALAVVVLGAGLEVVGEDVMLEEELGVVYGLVLEVVPGCVILERLLVSEVRVTSLVV